MLAGMARILFSSAGAAHIEPRPAVKAALLHVRHIVGHQVVAQAVALIGGAPQLAGRGVNGLAHAVTDAVGVHLHKFARGQELQHVGSMKLLGMRVGVVHVGVRSNRCEQLRAIL